jgi:hypothetical protein
MYYPTAGQGVCVVYNHSFSSAQRTILLFVGCKKKLVDAKGASGGLLSPAIISSRSGPSGAASFVCLMSIVGGGGSISNFLLCAFLHHHLFYSEENYHSFVHGKRMCFSLSFPAVRWYVCMLCVHFYIMFI